jgi:hypothetical protein
MLTPEQKATLKMAIVADNALNALYTDGNLSGLAAAINSVAQPEFIVWKTSVSVDEIMRNGMDWARVDNLTVGKARIWDWLGRLGSFDASKPNVRVGIDSAWVGTAADVVVRASIYTHCKRSATFVEKLLASGTGSDANPATMSYEGEVSWSELVGL